MNKIRKYNLIRFIHSFIHWKQRNEADSLIRKKN